MSGASLNMNLMNQIKYLWKNHNNPEVRKAAECLYMSMLGSIHGKATESISRQIKDERNY
jgi:hypothetical protein